MRTRAERGVAAFRPSRRALGPFAACCGVAVAVALGACSTSTSTSPQATASADTAPPPLPGTPVLPHCAAPGEPLYADERLVTADDEAAVEAALGFVVPGSPTCGFVHEPGGLGDWSRVIHLQYGGQPATIDELWQRFIEDDWQQASWSGPPVFRGEGVEVALQHSPPTMQVALR